MSFEKRYSVINFYVNGGSVVPQYGHGTSNLWKDMYAGKFTEEAKELFLKWAYEAETEVVLKGGDDESMEALFADLQKLEGIPSAKFNEPAMRGTCTVVTFVAPDSLISAGHYIRGNRLTPFNAVQELTGKVIPHIDPTQGSFLLNDTEIAIISKLAFMPLA